jgi:hypothetical protein
MILSFVLEPLTNAAEASRRAAEIGQATPNKLTRALRFLRQPSRPSAPRPVANSGRAAGSGVAGVAC